MKDYIINGYEPECLFHFFEELSAIPRGSHNEAGVADALVSFAQARGLDCYRDELNNVLIKKPATPETNLRYSCRGTPTWFAKKIPMYSMISKHSRSIFT